MCHLPNEAYSINHLCPIQRRERLLFMPERNTISEYLRFANLVADRARPIALSGFRSGCDVSYKADRTVVTEKDIEIETVVRAMVAETYPDHGIIGEEFEPLQADSPYVWVVDPIDGTEAYAYGLPTFGILLCLARDGVPVASVIDLPALGERWCGATGLPTTWQGDPCRSKSTGSLDSAIVFASSIDMFNQAEKRVFDRVSQIARHRRFGIDCYAYGMLACGYADVVMEAAMKTVDYMALAPVVAGSGGVITDWQGRALTLESQGTVLAVSNPALHEQCLAAIRETKQQIQTDQRSPGTP